MTGERISVLLAEDNEDHALLAKRALESSGDDIDVSFAIDGEEALKALKRRSFSMILSDYRLPRRSGLDLLKDLKRIGADIPLVIITSQGNEKVAVEAMREGAYDYIVKDQGYLDVLPHVVRRTMERYRSKKFKESLDEALRREKETLEQTNLALKKLDRLKSDLVSNVSHELRTPLISIKNAIEIVLVGKAGPVTEDQDRFLRLADRNLDRLSNLINDLLDLAKIESGKMSYDYTHVDLETTFQSAVASIQPLADKKSITMTTEIPADLPPLHADEAKIEQIMINLLGNAIKFSDKGGDVSISASAIPAGEVQDMAGGMQGDELAPADSWIKVTVGDRGRGIAEEDLAHIFEKFAPIRRQPVSNEEGSGLGLSIARYLVEGHWGRIWAESKLGEGSRFHFAIPLLNDEQLFTAELKREIVRARELLTPLFIVGISVGDIALPDGASKMSAWRDVMGTIEAVFRRTFHKLTDKAWVDASSGSVFATLHSASKIDIMDSITELKSALSHREVLIDGNPVEVTIEVGVASYPEDGLSVEELIANARGKKATEKSHEEACAPRVG